MNIHRIPLLMGVLTIIVPLCGGRSIHRPIDKTIPTITVCWGQASDCSLEKPSCGFLRDSHLRETPLFKTYDHEYLGQHMLPTGLIDYRYHPEEQVDGSQLSVLIEKLIKEIKANQDTFSDFTVLKRSNLSSYSHAGLIILKFNDYPFVLKLFMDDPYSFTKPNQKGFQTRGIFAMGGATRHTIGFTRLKNAELIQNRLSESPHWDQRVTLPRKWFWMPTKPQWLTINAHNVGEAGSEKTVQIPAVYAIVCDAIEPDPRRTPAPKECLQLCDFLEFTLDPHVTNFLIEKGTGALAIIDTESFPILMGAHKKIPSTRNYIGWYVRLGRHYMRERLFSSKRRRLKRQKRRNNYYHL